jgi:hypothetical protein
VLGPILFLILIRDINSVAERNTVMKKFADDTKAGRAVVGQADVDEMQRTLDR